jgi:hypothetical protein
MRRPLLITFVLLIILSMSVSALEPIGSIFGTTSGESRELSATIPAVSDTDAGREGFNFFNIFFGEYGDRETRLQGSYDAMIRFCEVMDGSLWTGGSSSQEDYCVNDVTEPCVCYDAGWTDYVKTCGTASNPNCESSPNYCYLPNGFPTGEEGDSIKIEVGGTCYRYACEGRSDFYWTRKATLPDSDCGINSGCNGGIGGLGDQGDVYYRWEVDHCEKYVCDEASWRDRGSVSDSYCGRDGDCTNPTGAKGSKDYEWVDGQCWEYTCDGVWSWTGWGDPETDCGQTPPEEQTCYTCSGNDVVAIAGAREAKPLTLWQKFISTITGREATTDPLCEDQYGVCSRPDFDCENGVAVTNLDYFKPRISAFQVKDSVTGQFVDPNVADLSNYGPGDEVEIYVEFTNEDAKYYAQDPSRNVNVGREGISDWIDNWKRVSTRVYQKVFTATGPAREWYSSKVENDFLRGEILDFTIRTSEWVLNTVGIDATGVREDYNLRLINMMPEYNYVRAELAFYSRDAGEVAYGYGANRQGFGREAGVFADSLTIVPACQGKEDVDGYIKSFSLLMSPEIDGVCKVYDGTSWYVAGAEHGGACKFKIKTTIEVPDSGDAIASGLSNVDPEQKYYLHAAIFDRCWNEGAPTRELANTGILVQVGEEGQEPEICCAKGSDNYYTTVSACTSAGGNQVDSLLCEEGETYSQECCRCEPDGSTTCNIYTDDSRISCGRGIASEDRWTKSEASQQCGGGGNPELHTCYKCVGTVATAGEFGIDVPCGTGVASNYPHTEQSACNPNVETVKCYGCKEGVDCTDNSDLCMREFAVGTICKDVGAYPYTLAEITKEETCGYEDPTDRDGDRVSDNIDNCPDVYNPDQTPSTTNPKLGAACDDPEDDDEDDDGIPDGIDNCPSIYNPDQDPNACGENAKTYCYKCTDDGNSTSKAYDYGYICSENDGWFKGDDSGYIYSKEEAQSECAPSGLKAYVNPDDESEFCVDLLGTKSCHKRKELLELSELDQLDTLSFWTRITSGLIYTQSDNPICVNYLGDAQCSDGGVCLAAINDNRDKYKENKKVFDAIRSQTGNWLEETGNFLAQVTTLFLFESDLDRQAQQYGVCVYEERDATSVINRWIADLFGLDPDDPMVTYILFGGIGLIGLFIYLLSKPPKPRGY